MNVMYPKLLSFCYNFLADYIILFFVRKDLFPETKLKRVIQFTFIFSFTYILWEKLTAQCPSIFRIILKWLFLYSILCILFRIRSVKLFIKTGIVFFLYLFLLAGSLSFFLSYINKESVDGVKTAYKAMLIMLISAIFLAFWKYIKQKEKQEKVLQDNLYEVQISRKGKNIKEWAMYDSGNLMTCEITGQGVCILPERQARQLLMPEEWKQIELFYNRKSTDIFTWKEWAKQFQSGIYTLQYFTVGKKKEKMPGIMAEEIVVLKNKEVLVKTKGMLGISLEEISEKNKFSVLLPADIFDREKNRSII